MLTQLHVLAGVILPIRDLSKVQNVKADLCLRYFQNQPVQMELMDGDEVMTDTQEVVDGMRLQLRVGDQVRTRERPPVATLNSGAQWFFVCATHEQLACNWNRLQ